MTSPAATLQPVVIDASVWVAFFLRTDANHAASYQWINHHTAADGEMVAPTILLPEVASSMARRTGKLRRGLNALNTLESLTLLGWVQMEHDLMREAAQTAVTLGLRSADAIYVAVAKRLNIPLLTLDNEQLTRGASIIATMQP
jgi:predicted nucleic acid-binding protein